jgi:restriction system protein
MWEYAETGLCATLSCFGDKECRFCYFPMLHFPAQKAGGGECILFRLSICIQCGWWNVFRVHQHEDTLSAEVERYFGAAGCLKELDYNDISVPLGEVRQYIMAKRDSLWTAHPRLLENLVCSVFASLGWHARVTAYTGDNGIDVVLDGPSGSTIGVQVKRYKKKRKIEAEQIRSFAGALLINGHTKGIFVTTSGFRKGATRTAQESAFRGYPVELWDANAFLAALGVAQIKSLPDLLRPERLTSYISMPGLYLGLRPFQEFIPGEDLWERGGIGMLTTPEVLRQVVEELTTENIANNFMAYMRCNELLKENEQLEHKIEQLEREIALARARMKDEPEQLASPRSDSLPSDAGCYISLCEAAQPSSDVMRLGSSSPQTGASEPDPE